MNRIFYKKSYSILIALIAFITIKGFSQGEDAPFTRDSVISAVREIITSNQYCALVTVDSTGQPQVRTMNPFPLGDELVIWFATARKSRKVTEIRNEPRVCVYYADHTNAKGYVNIAGRAEVIDDVDLLVKMKRAYWENIPNWKERFVLIKITPVTLEVINYKKGFVNDPETLRAPTIDF